MRIKTIASFVVVGLIALLGLVSSVSAFTSTGDGATINIENYYESEVLPKGEEILGATIRPIYTVYDFKSGLYAAGAEIVNSSGDLLADTDTFFVDISTDRVGINTSTPSYPFQIASSSAAGASLVYVDTEGNLVVSGNITYGGFQTSTANPEVTTLTVTGSTTLNGGLAMDTNAFTVADVSGNTAIGGTLTVTGATAVTASTTLNGGLAVDTSKFFVADVTGLVGVGTSTPVSILHVDGGMTVSSTLNLGALGAAGDPGDGRVCVYDSSVGYFIIATPSVSASHVPSLAFTTSSAACN